MRSGDSSELPVFGDDDALYQSIKGLIERSRTQVVAQVNQTLVMTYWQVGKTIKTTLVTENRAEYGSGIVDRLAQKLSQDYGRGFGRGNLFRMMRFYEQFPDEQIVLTVSAQLSWSHFVELLKLDEPLKREFYLQLCADGRWSVRTLRGRIDSMLFERAALSKQPDALIRQELTNLQKQSAETSPALFLKDPYLLDFLDLKDNFSEKDLENAVLFELEKFIFELGNGVARWG